MRVLLHTLGRLATTVDSVTSTAIASQPVRAALLVYLAVEGETTRQRVAGVLWPDRDEARARHVLSQTLYQLRTDFGEGVIAAEGETLRAGPDLWVDAVVFRDSAEAGEVEDALALYGGPFLLGLVLAETNAFETWVDLHRARLSRLHRRARREHVRALRAARRDEEALQVALEWADLEPLEDEAQHEAIDLLARGGRVDEALQRYEDHVRALAREDLAPIDETRQLVERLRGVTVAPGPTDAEPAGEPDREPGPTAPHEGRRPRQLGRWAAAFLGLAALIAAVLTGVVSRGERSVIGADGPEQVLVLPFQNDTGDPSLDPLGHMAADWLAHKLAGLGGLQVMPTIDVLRRTAAEPAVAVTAPPSSALARETGIDLIVSGRYYQNGADVELYAQITDAASGRLWLTLEPASAPRSAAGTAVEELGRHIMGSLAARVSTEVPLEGPSVAHPPTWEAWLAYDRGARHFIEGAFNAAIPHLIDATRLDSSFVRPLLLAASGYGNQGDYARQDSLLEALHLRLDRLAPYERAHLEWLRARLRGDPDAAYSAASRATSLAPGGPAHYVFARAALAWGRPTETLEAFGTLPMSTEWMPVWWNAWEDLTGAYHALAQHRRELEEARRALEADGRLRMRVLELRALAAVGRPEEVMALLDSAALQPPDRALDFGDVLRRTASELRAHGYRALADSVLERAALWYAGIPSPTLSGRAAQAQVLAFLGRLASAEAVLSSLPASDSEQLSFLGLTGVVAALRGDSRRAAEVDDSLAMLRRPYLRGANTWWRAAVAARLGRHDQALRLLRQARDEGRSLGFSLHAEPLFEPLWDLPAYASLVVVDR